MIDSARRAQRKGNAGYFLLVLEKCVRKLYGSFKFGPPDKNRRNPPTCLSTSNDGFRLVYITPGSGSEKIVKVSIQMDYSSSISAQI